MKFKEQLYVSALQGIVTRDGPAVVCRAPKGMTWRIIELATRDIDQVLHRSDTQYNEILKDIKNNRKEYGVGFIWLMLAGIVIRAILEYLYRLWFTESTGTASERRGRDILRQIRKLQSQED